jgi:hypothetical protein
VTRSAEHCCQHDKLLNRTKENLWAERGFKPSFEIFESVRVSQEFRSFLLTLKRHNQFSNGTNEMWSTVAAPQASFCVVRKCQGTELPSGLLLTPNFFNGISCFLIQNVLHSFCPHG